MIDRFTRSLAGIERSLAYIDAKMVDGSEETLQSVVSDLPRVLSTIDDLIAFLDDRDARDESVSGRQQESNALALFQHEARGDLLRLRSGLRAALLEAEARLTGEDASFTGSRVDQTFQRLAAESLGDWQAWQDLVRSNRETAKPGEDATGGTYRLPQ